MDDPGWLYLIEQGVHRSVAAREVGLPGVLAEVRLGGELIGLRVVPLERLVSPKPVIGRYDRNRDFRQLVELVGSAAGRATLFPVFVSAVSAARAARFTPLLEVRIVDDPEEDRP